MGVDVAMLAVDAVLSDDDVDDDELFVSKRHAKDDAPSEATAWFWRWGWGGPWWSWRWRWRWRRGWGPGWRRRRWMRRRR